MKKIPGLAVARESESGGNYILEVAGVVVVDKSSSLYDLQLLADKINAELSRKSELARVSAALASTEDVLRRAQEHIAAASDWNSRVHDECRNKLYREMRETQAHRDFVKGYYDLLRVRDEKAFRRRIAKMVAAEQKLSSIDAVRRRATNQKLKHLATSVSNMKKQSMAVTRLLRELSR